MGLERTDCDVQTIAQLDVVSCDGGDLGKERDPDDTTDCRDGNGEGLPGWLGKAERRGA